MNGQRDERRLPEVLRKHVQGPVIRRPVHEDIRPRKPL